MTAFTILYYQEFSPPQLLPGPKECKHYILFDFKVLILYFQQNVDPHLHSSLLGPGSKARFPCLWHCMLILTALFGDFVCYLCPPVFCSIADFGLWLRERPVSSIPLCRRPGFPVFPGHTQNHCFCIPGLGDAQVTTGMNLAWVNHLCSPTILSFGKAQPALTFQLLRRWLSDIQQKMSSGLFEWTTNLDD